MGGTGQNKSLLGKLCSYSWASASSSSWVYFDGKGGMKYGSEPSMSSSSTVSGRYEVQGDMVYMQFGNGSSGSAAVDERINSMITALVIEGTVYSRQQCE